MTALDHTGLWEVDHETYHADLSRDSHSSLSLFRESVPRYAALRVFRTMEPSEPTAAMQLGTLFHTFVLEPEKFRDEYMVMPKLDRRTKEGKAQYETLMSSGRSIVSAEDFALITAMRDGLMTNPQARKVMESAGDVEQSVVWTDADSGVPLKIRSDKTLETGIVVNLKTAISVKPDDLQKAIWNLGYHTQAALYLEGMKQGLDVDAEYLFVAVCKEPPHETVCFVLDEQTLARGRVENQVTLAELAIRRQTGDWSSRFNDQIFTLSLPKWANARS